MCLNNYERVYRSKCHKRDASHAKVSAVEVPVLSKSIFAKFHIIRPSIDKMGPVQIHFIGSLDSNGENFTPRRKVKKSDESNKIGNLNQVFRNLFGLQMILIFFDNLSCPFPIFHNSIKIFRGFKGVFVSWSLSRCLVYLIVNLVRCARVYRVLGVHSNVPMSISWDDFSPHWVFMPESHGRI